MTAKTARPLMEVVNLIVDIQISLSMNPPMYDKNDQRYKYRAALLNELVFAVDRDGEIITEDDVAARAKEPYLGLSQRVFALEQELFKVKAKAKTKKVTK